MLKAVIYDMDGVLVDTEPLHYRVNCILMKKYDVSLEFDYYKQFIGSNNQYMFNKLIKDFNLEITSDYLIEEMSQIKQHIIDKEGYPKIEYAKDGVKDLSKKYKLAVASSSSIEDIKRVTEYFDIRNYFNVLISGSTLKNPKPAPDIFLKAALELNVKPEECIVIEDSYNGVLAAKNAGMVCIGLDTGDFISQDLSKADYIITSHECVSSEFMEMVYAHSLNIP